MRHATRAASVALVSLAALLLPTPKAFAQG